ncbi:MAG: hybrid sensor histidine kinase/response regulator [Anaerolineae bacterium]|nr:hybrid sensor histidine kinase/response regulator [Anaerolineae bacterium]
MKIEKGQVFRQEARVLIAEDDYLIRCVIRQLLEERGYTIVGEAQDGLQALELTINLKPDVIVMDIQMPDMNGLQAMRRINQVHPTPVVILTAYETSDLMHEAVASGAGAYVVKPSTGRELERAITVAMARFADMMALRQLNAELQTVNQDLEAFAHTVAHDLRHLLSPIMGYSDVLYHEYDTFSQEDVREDLYIIYETAHQMNDLIEELLLLAHLRQEDVDTAPLEMDKVVYEALNRLQFQIQHTGARILSSNDWPAVLGYAPWVRQVWINYVSNAIKYGGKSPFIELGWTQENATYAQFWVRDYGAGIGPEKLPFIFSPPKPSRGNVYSNHGFGLSIVKLIVEKLGGEVGVKSEPGAGSTFSFTLPSAIQ